jgi:TetR/AcrR family transcriptional regulator, transcriptional repressor of bet genes
MHDRTTGDRRKFRREGEGRRREALMTATLELVAEAGVSGATVRAIAERAGVTPGLIRHYFEGKDELVRAAYATVMNRMTAESAAAAEPEGDDPVARLRAFVAVSLRPPVMDAERVGLWAGFLHQVRRDPAMRVVHEATYLAYRDRLQALIEALPDRPTCVSPRALAIACNGMIDGLWMEGGVLPEAFAEGELETIGLGAIGAILGVDLSAPRETGVS